MLLTALALAWAGPAVAQKTQFKFNSWTGPEISVFVTHPAGLEPDRPVVFVMHGVNRNADDYRDQWHELAIKYQFLLIVPEFSKSAFPRSRSYNLGNVFDANGKAVDKENWSYTAIDLIFEDVRKRFSVSTKRYSLYGHSAGAQFVHRFIFYQPHARVSRIVSANAGWYMMPNSEWEFPYGLSGSTVSNENLKRALTLPVTILLGDQDTDPQDPNLRRTPEALAQGDYRLARGKSFFNAARVAAQQLHGAFNWQLATVEGVGHDNALMAPAAIRYLLEIETPSTTPVSGDAD